MEARTFQNSCGICRSETLSSKAAVSNGNRFLLPRSKFSKPITETFTTALKTAGPKNALKSRRKSKAGFPSLKQPERSNLMNGNNKRPMILQKRDLEFFKVLGKYARLVDRRQAMKFAGFNSQTRANARLLKLTSNGFLR